MKQKDFQMIVDLTSEELGIKTIPVRIKDTFAGHANKKYITLPKWIENYDVKYQIYYAVHETCHYGEDGKRREHNLLFKETEDKMLKLWGITITRKKAYPKTLNYNGQSIKNIPK